MKQVVREAIEIRIFLISRKDSKISINRDLGEYSFNALYTNLIKNDSANYIKKNSKQYHSTIYGQTV